MSLRSSNSLLETSFKATVRIFLMNDEFAHACHVVFVLCNAAGSDAKKRLNCKNVRRIKLSAAVYVLHSYSVFSLMALKELPVDDSLQISKLQRQCSHRAQGIGKGSQT